MNEYIASYFETPEQMAEHLEFMMQFYHYSLRNTALIQNQFSGAQAVGSYKFWKEKGFQDRKSTRLNSSHVAISYAVFCLKKKKEREANWKSTRPTTWMFGVEGRDATPND